MPRELISERRVEKNGKKYIVKKYKKQTIKENGRTYSDYDKRKAELEGIALAQTHKDKPVELVRPISELRKKKKL